MMTPFHLLVLLHYHFISDFILITNWTIQLKNARTALVRDGLIEKSVLNKDEDFKLTTKGVAYISIGLTSVPLPEQIWAIPKK